MFGTLKEGMHIEDFLTESFADLMSAADLESMLGLFEPDDEDFDETVEKAEAYFNVLLACATTQLYFFLPIGQYLQLLQPFCFIPFTYHLDDKFIKALHDSSEETFQHMLSFVLYLSPLDCYKLSPLGVDLFRNGIPEKRQLFQNVPHKEYKSVLNGMLSFDASDAFDNILNRMFNDLAKNNDITQKKEKTSSIKLISKSSAADKNADYMFEVKKWRGRKPGKTFTLKGKDTMADLADRIISDFNLDLFHLYGFYMGDEFYDPQTEIMASDSGGYDERGAAEYYIYNLDFSKTPNFLFLYDYGTEHRFQIKFLGKG